MLFTLPHALPASYVTQPGVQPISDVDTGGYDFTLGGHGFRLAADANTPYTRYSEPTTVHRFDNSLEPGEQTLAQLPWIKAQSSFHGGAGQLNLEQGFTAFQYQQEQVEHIRFEKSLGVDVWSVGEVKRLPDSLFTDLGITPASSTAASSGGDDYIIVGTNGGGLWQVKITDPDSAPTVTEIDLSGVDFGGASNCNITSLATDGSSWYGLFQLATANTTGAVTVIGSGALDSTGAPTMIYRAGISGTVIRTNLCSNPNFEGGVTTGWTGGTGGISVSTTYAHSGTYSLNGVTSAYYSFNAAGGLPYTFSGFYKSPATGSAQLQFYDSSGSRISAILVTMPSGLSNWTNFSITSTAPTGTATIRAYVNNNNGGSFYIDDLIIEQSATAGAYFDGSTTDTSTYQYDWTGDANASTSTQSLITGVEVDGVLSWAKFRLMAGLGSSLYELPPGGGGTLPTPRYTHPVDTWLWTSISESPNGVLAAGDSDENQAAILELNLDTSGGTPYLTGGTVKAVFPSGEKVLSMASVLGSFLAVGTSRGLRLAQWDSGDNMNLGPLTVETTKDVSAVATRDRFVYGSYTDQQEDGSTGLARADLTMVVDTGGRNAWAADLRPKTTDPQTGAVLAIHVLPSSNRVAWLTASGLYVEGGAPGSDGDAWIRTSRIRYDTAEPKLWVSGRVHGTLDQANLTVTGITPFGSDVNLGTFGHLVSNDDSKVQFGLPDGLHEWIQLQFGLDGAGAVLNTYQAKAIPAPTRQHIIQVSANCFTNEVDRFGLEVTDPETPRQRWQNLADLESSGNACRFVEFTNTGAVATLVFIDQIQYQQSDPPTIDSDFGGIITLKLRVVEG